MSSNPRATKRRRKAGVLLEDDVAAAHAVTSETVTVQTKSGPKIKSVLVPLVPPKSHVRDDEIPMTSFEDTTPEFAHEEFVPPRPSGKKQRDYVQEFVDRVKDLLQASLFHETRPEDTHMCNQCSSNWAVWRCVDCTLAQPMCRHCIRQGHRQSPFHRIERWNGSFFRRASLWEVGSYVLVRHHCGTGICSSLRFQINFLEEIQEREDELEQQDLKNGCFDRPREITGNKRSAAAASPPASASASASIPVSDTTSEQESEAADDGYSNTTWEQEATDDADFFSNLDRRREQMEISDELKANDGEDNADADAADSEVPLNAYLDNRDPQWRNRPSGDALNNTYVRVLHVNGIHHIAMVACHCRGELMLPLELVASRLLPASFTRIRTLFTCDLMDYFRLCNLELKVSAYQFYELIRRLTLPLGRGDIVNLYHEFRRMSRLWRWMKKLKWAGFGHRDQDPARPGLGELANFCPACPRPNINLPANWKEDPNRFVYKLFLVADGNFKADHVRQKSDGDVWLFDGAGMVPNRDQYFTFLATAIERFTKAPCENTFRAIANALLASKACDLTGVIALACARHGCFVPNTLADLFKGEQQKNVDFALLKAFSILGLDPEQGILLIYDIVCQYFVHLHERIGRHLPAGLTIDRAIDLFHVHAHKDECFFRYATTFIPGTGVVAGQILESLWSNLNAISPTVRTATLPHRAEMLDDHACDSNHKKMLNMPDTLCTRYLDAVAMVKQTETYYRDIVSVVDGRSLRKWEQDIRNAEDERLRNPKSMDLYAARLPDTLGTDPTSAPAPAPASTVYTPMQIWIEFGLEVEEKQIEIQDRVRRLRTNPRPDEQDVIDQLRQALTAMLIKLKRLQDDARATQNPGSVAFQEDETAFDEVEWGQDDGPSGATNSVVVVVERQILALPSNGNVGNSGKAVELHYRQGQIRLQINKLRDIVAEISFHFSHILRGAVRRSVRSHGQRRLKTLQHELTLHARIYCRCRSRLIALNCPPQFLLIYRELKKEDLKASTAILRPNQPGSSNLQLSWIWHTTQRYLFTQSADPDPGADPASLLEFKRVHWLRARAQQNRWREEVKLLTYEMSWTVRYCQHQTETWRAGVNPNSSDGARAYALRQVFRWTNSAHTADKMFKRTNEHYISPIA